MGTACGDGGNPGGWRSTGSAQFSLPVLGTSLEFPQAVMLGGHAGARKGICLVDRAVWQDAQGAPVLLKGGIIVSVFVCPGLERSRWKH